MNWKDASCIVTGGSGFLGSHLSDALLHRGARVTVVDLKPLPPHLEGKVEFVRTDIADLPDLSAPSYIFHLAALAYPSACNEFPSKALRSNAEGTLKMLSFAQEKKVKKLIFPSSAQLYGRFPTYFPIDEKHPLDYTDNFYNISKKFGEDLCTYFAPKVPLVYFRLFNSFGPRQDKEYLIPTIISQAIEKGVIELWNEKPTRDFTYVADTVDAFIKAVESPFTGGPINIGSGTETTVGDIAKGIASAFGAQVKFLNKDVVGSLRMQCNPLKAKTTIGWEPTIPFREGLEKTIAWYKKELA